MTLVAGRRLGSYEILAPLGAGGMGEVYRAKDTKLEREVAVKVLPDRVASDADALARFEREAKAVASLSHPNILAIHDFGTQDGIAYAVMELLEGETFRERLRSGALPVRKAVDYAQQVAHGLGAAHEKGIVHRDLKPENVFVTRDGQVKVLDFGLARQRPNLHDDASSSATVTRHTEPGTVMGTAGYMSPEQARGLAVDHRTDIFSFGAILYEMLAGERAFAGATPADTISAILSKEPSELAPRVDGISPALERIVRHCLEKEPGERFRSAEDVRFALAALSDSTVSASSTRIGASWIPRSTALLAAALAGALATAFALRGRNEAPRATIARLNVLVPEGDRLTGHTPLALSPDGTVLAYVARHRETQSMFVRRVDQLEARSLPGTEGARDPFFSPDGRWIGFNADGKLKKIRVEGGAAVTLADALHTHGASWASTGDIFFVPDQTGTGVWRVSANGGVPARVTTVLAERGEVLQEWPAALPGGRKLLVSVVGRTRSWEEARIEVRSTTTGERLSTAVEGGFAAKYAPSGHLLFIRRGRLHAVRFDPDAASVIGSPVEVVSGVRSDSANGGTFFAVAEDSLVYEIGDDTSSQRRLVAVARNGNEEPLLDAAGYFLRLDLSPDGRRLVVAQLGVTATLWTIDIGRRTLTRLTSEDVFSIAALFSPDGSRIAFLKATPAGDGIAVADVGGAGPVHSIVSSQGRLQPGGWHPDGDSLAYSELASETGWDIWVAPVSRAAPPTLLVGSRAGETDPVFSPDGRFIAYGVTEAGRSEVHVRPYPGPGGAVQVSTTGGILPRWIRGTRELAYISSGQLWVVPVDTRASLEVGQPRPLFRTPYVTSNANYAVTPDGQRFFFVKSEDPPQRPLVFVRGFAHELRRTTEAAK